MLLQISIPVATRSLFQFIESNWLKRFELPKIWWKQKLRSLNDKENILWDTNGLTKIKQNILPL